MCAQLLRRGFCVVRMSECAMAAVQQGWALCGLEHARRSYDEMIEFGYSGRLRHTNKAFFAVKKAQPLHLLGWPEEEGFRDGAVALFDALDGEARRVLRVLGEGMQVQWSKLECMLDEDPLACNEVSTSFMHLFDYLPCTEEGGGGEAVKDACTPHTDSGMVTIIPRATSPGLQVMDWSTGQWVATETTEEENVCTVLVGETLARLTCCHLQASVHRVVAPPPGKVRLSMPFQLRASVHAVIDSVGLECPLLTHVPQHYRQVVKVSDFLG